MTFQLNEDAMRPIVAKAILEEIGQEQRDLLIQNALDNLLKPTKSVGDYGRSTNDGPSMLEQAIRDQTRNLANEIVQELLQEPELAARVRDVVRDGIMKGLQENDNGWLLSSIGYAAGEAVTRILQEKR